VNGGGVTGPTYRTEVSQCTDMVGIQLTRSHSTSKSSGEYLRSRFPTAGKVPPAGGAVTIPVGALEVTLRLLAAD
jgi:hypothetical protein